MMITVSAQDMYPSLGFDFEVELFVFSWHDSMSPLQWIFTYYSLPMVKYSCLHQGRRKLNLIAPANYNIHKKLTTKRILIILINHIMNINYAKNTKPMFTTVYKFITDVVDIQLFCFFLVYSEEHEMVQPIHA